MGNQTIRVTRRQIESAKALVKLRGGLDKVDPYIRKVATAAPATREHSGDRTAS